MKLLKRYTSRVVLAFDADAAGQGAAERFYEWERQYDIEVSVAKLWVVKILVISLSQILSRFRAIEQASPFLAFRIDGCSQRCRQILPNIELEQLKTQWRW